MEYDFDNSLLFDSVNNHSGGKLYYFGDSIYCEKLDNETFKSILTDDIYTSDDAAKLCDQITNSAQ